MVFNHTAEGGHDGPTLSFRGLDNNAYYILESDPESANRRSRRLPSLSLELARGSALRSLRVRNTSRLCKPSCRRFKIQKVKFSVQTWSQQRLGKLSSIRVSRSGAAAVSRNRPEIKVSGAAWFITKDMPALH